MSGLPAPRAADGYALVHFLLAGVFAYALLVDVTRRRAAALLGGIAWMLGARTIQSAIWPNAVGAAAYLPLLVLGILRIGRGRRASGIAFAAVAAGLLALNARPHSVVGSLPVIVAAAAFAVWTAAEGRRSRALLDVGLAALFAVGLGAPSLLPTAILHPEMDRAAGLSAAERNVDALRWGGDLDEVFLPTDGRGRFPEAAAYAGAVALVLFLLGGALTRGTPERGLFFALAAGGVVAFVFAFGDAGPYRAFSWLPVLRDLHVPPRYLISWAFAVAIGAGLAASALAARSAAGGRLAAFAVVVLAADLVVHARRTAPVADAAHYRATPPLAGLLFGRGTDASGFPRRFWTTRVGLPDRTDPRTPPEWAAAHEPMAGALGLRYGLEGLEGRGLALLRVRRLLDAAGPKVARLAAVDSIVSELPSLPFTKVGGDPPVWRVEGALPRAWVVPRAVRVPPGAALRAALSPAFDPAAAVLVEGLEADAPPAPEGPSSVRLVERRGGHVVLDVASPGGFLVLADAYERGWRASVSGLETPVLPANGAFRAVAVPAGTCRVAFDYTPRGLKEGAGLFLASALGLVFACRRVRARR